MRRRPALLLAIVIGLLPITMPAASADDEVADLEAELAETEASLTTAMERLASARRELEAVEERLSVASAQLGRARVAAEEAEANYLAAEEEAELTAAALVVAEENLVRAEAMLESALEREAVAIDRLEKRVVKAFKDGSTYPALGLAHGIVNAGDWHDVARSAQIMQRVLADDRAIVEEALAARREADIARGEADRSRRHAQDLAVLAERTAEQAAEQLAELEQLVAEHQAAVNAVAAEQRRRQSIFAELEADASVMQALANELSRKIAQLRSGGVCVGRVSTGGPGFNEGSLPSWGRRLVSRIGSSEPWVYPVAVAARRHGVDAPVFAALVWSESAFRPTVVSHAGAIGLAQLMPGTASGLGVDPWDPEQNLDGGARYLAMQVSRFGSLELGLAAYNAGPGNVIKYGGIPPFAETQIYVVRVIDRCQQIAT